MSLPRPVHTHLCADDVLSVITGVCLTEAVPVVACHRAGAAALEWAAEDILEGLGCL